MSDDKFSLSSLVKPEVCFVKETRKRPLDESEEDGGGKMFALSPETSSAETSVQVVFVDDILTVEGVNESISDESLALTDPSSSPVQDTSFPANSLGVDLPDEINGLPVFSYNERGVTLKQTLEICISSKFDMRYACDHAPRDVFQSCSLILDLYKVEHRDIVAGDNGMFGRHSSPSRYLSVKIASDGKVLDFKPLKNGAVAELPPPPGYNNYRLKRQYSWHKQIKGFSRIVTRVDQNGVSFRYAVVQFKVPSAPGVTSPQKPLRSKCNIGNAKPSSVVCMERNVDQGVEYEQEVQVSATCTVTSTERPQPHVMESELHSSTASNPTDTGRTDIYNILKTVNSDKPKAKSKPIPDYSRLLATLQADDFLRDVSFSSVVGDSGKLNVRTFAMGEVQEHWLKTFCSGANPKSCASIAMNYRLGEHYVITMTCPLPMFVSKSDNNTHPVVLLVLMTSLTHDKSDYDYFANNLRRLGVTSMVYGTSGDEASSSGLESSFPIHGPSSTSAGNIHLCCFNKAKTILCTKLEELNINKHDSDVILKQILGGGSEPVPCLVDQGNEAGFDATLNIIQATWPAEFRTWFRSSGSKVRSFADTIKKCMLRPVRARAGLGNPPLSYSNKQTIKLLHNAILELNGIDSDSLDLVKMHEAVKSKVIEGQVAEFVKAMYNMGDLRLSQAYKHLCVPLLSIGK